MADFRAFCAVRRDLDTLSNCSLTVIKIFPYGSMKLLSFGDVGHLPPNLSTGTPPGEPVNLDIPSTTVTD